MVGKIEVQSKALAAQKPALPPILAMDHPKRDNVPENLLNTLTQAGKKFQNLGPRNNNNNSTKKPAIKRNDNVWNHEKGRGKFKHLLEQPTCYCGAGSDISYLMDATTKKTEPLEEDSKPISTTEKLDSSIDHGKTMIPESIIPSEFHIKKHKGVMGMEIHQNQFTTLPEEHEEHFTIFPSMKPSGRQEALQLMQVMNTLLKKAGIEEPTSECEELNTQESDSQEESQIEALLNLVKEEQKVYNIIFNEVIRQVSVECIERGTVLAELRKRYAKMLDRVPKQVKSLHEEVLAQRALDRRLTEELGRFKTSITLLTKELHEIHAHDEEVTRQAIETQAELNEALKESEKNASLLAEYHDLYELQRRRLDYQLSKLIEERDLWAGSAHMLSLKVTDKHNLVTVRRLHLYQKAWHKLANRFTVVLGQSDAKQLQEIADHCRRWQETVISFDEKLREAEQEAYRRMKSVQSSLKLWSEKFDRVVTPTHGSIHPLEQDDLQSLFNILKSWEEIFNSEVERYSGDVLLSYEDDLLCLNNCMDAWTRCSIKVYGNHAVQDGTSKQREAMLDLNEEVERLHYDFQLRMSGENGVVPCYLNIFNALDTWVNKVNVLVHGGETMFDSEWAQLTDLFQSQWPETLQKVLNILSPEDENFELGGHPPEDSRLNLSDGTDIQMISKNATIEKVEKWLLNIINGFENENTNMIEQVSTTHWNMIRWLVTILIRMAPDHKSPKTPIRGAEEDKLTGLGSAILKESTSDAIIDRCTMIFNSLRSLTDLIVACCKDLSNGTPDVTNNAVEKIIEDSAKDAKNLEQECQGWMNTANLLIKELTGQSIPMKDFIPSAKLKRGGQQQQDNENKSTTEQPKIGVPGQENNPETGDKKEGQPIVVLNSADKKNETNVPSSEKQDGKGMPTINVSEGAQVNKTADEADSSPDSDEESEEGEESDDGSQMLVIGNDENVKRTSVNEQTENINNNQKNITIDVTSPSLSLEALSTLEKLQTQLIETEDRAQQAEEKLYVTENELKEANERIRALERSLSRMESKSETSTPLPP